MTDPVSVVADTRTQNESSGNWANLVKQREPTKQPRVLIVNLHSKRNAGDAAALEMAVALIRKVFPQAQISLSINDPSSCSGAEDAEVLGSFFTIVRPSRKERQVHQALLKMPIVLVESLCGALWFRALKRPYRSLFPFARDLLTAYMVSDLVISAPGNVFLTKARMGLPFLASLFRAAYAVMLGKRLYIMPQSIGPFRQRWERWLTRWLLSKAALVFTRDVVSFRLLQEMGLTGPQHRLVPDVVFAFPPAPRERASHVLRRYGVDIEEDRPLLGWTAINPFVKHIEKESWKNYGEILSLLVPRFAREHGGKAIFFPQVTGPWDIEDDRKAARRIIARMKGDSERVVFIDEPLPPALLKTACGLMDLFLATRMHSGVFALSAGVPTLAVGYLSKTRGIMEMLGLDEWVLEIDSLEEEVLWATLEALWEEREAIRGHLRQTIPAFAEQIHHLGGIIAEDFYGR